MDSFEYKASFLVLMRLEVFWTNGQEVDRKWSLGCWGLENITEGER
jgi:hypothetical protein